MRKMDNADFMHTFADIVHTLWRLSYTCATGAHSGCLQTSVTFFGSLESKHRIQQMKVHRAKRRLQSMPRFGPKTRLETENEIKLVRIAQALARSHGRDLPYLGDFHEALENPRRCGDRRVE